MREVRITVSEIKRRFKINSPTEEFIFVIVADEDCKIIYEKTKEKAGAQTK